MRDIHHLLKIARYKRAIFFLNDKTLRNTLSKTKDFKMRIIIQTIIIIFTLALMTGAHAASKLAEGTTYNNSQIASMFANSGNSYLASNAQTFANMSTNVENRWGNTAVYNGSCCTGLMQMNQSNLKTFCQCTKEQYASMSGEQQIGVYTKYFESIQNDPSVKTLMQMQANGQTLGGYPVTGATVAACIQLGTGNCAKAIKNGCRSASRADGGDGYVSICTMGDKAAKGNGKISENQPFTQETDPTNPIGNALISGGNDASTNLCWSCEAAIRSFNIIQPVISTVSDTLGAKLPVILGLIFAIYMLFKTVEMFVSPFPKRNLVQIMGLWARFAVIMLIILSNTVYTDYIQEYAMAPAMGLGAQLGTEMFSFAKQAFGIS
jgi:hypothetical protein